MSLSREACAVGIAKGQIACESVQHPAAGLKESEQEFYLSGGGCRGGPGKHITGGEAVLPRAELIPQSHVRY